MDGVIELGGVTKRYSASGPPALDKLSLTVAAGEAVAVMGPSGSGVRAWHPCQLPGGCRPGRKACHPLM